jgi:hypothetical protein
MLRREFLPVLTGALTVILGGAIFLNSFGDEPLWVEWLLGPAVVFAGLLMAIVGVAMYCYSAGSAADAGSTAAAKQIT